MLIGQFELVDVVRPGLTAREHVIALEPRHNGMVGTTLRYPYEVRQAKDYFDVIEDEKVPKHMLER